MERSLFCRCNFLTVMISLSVGVLLYVLILQKEVQDEFSLKIRRTEYLVQPAWLKTPPDKVWQFVLDLKGFLHRTNKRFLSFSIDSSQIYYGLRNPSLSNVKLRRMVSHLSGGYLRIGGTAADELVFTPAFRSAPHRTLPLDGGFCSHLALHCPSRPRVNKFSMHAYDWTELNDFASGTGLKMLFDLNLLLRTNSTWNSNNAELLLDFSFAYHYDIDWQLGNEPNSFKHNFGVEVPPESLAKDLSILRSLLRRYRLYNSSLLVGPDVTNPRLSEDSGTTHLSLNPRRYLLEFLLSKPDIDAISWHFYNTSPNATLEDYLNISNYESFEIDCSAIFETIKESKISSKPVWLTETGSSYGGGAQELSDRFASSLLWTDKLGVAAKCGIELVVRQSLYRGNYALIQAATLQPNPDYWVSVLYKQLVGEVVLNLTLPNTGTGGSPPSLRAYAHCATSNGSATLFGVNISNTSEGFYLALNSTGRLFCLTSPHLQSRSVELNGEELVLSYDGSLPKFNWIPAYGSAEDIPEETLQQLGWITAGIEPEHFYNLTLTEMDTITSFGKYSFLTDNQLTALQGAIFEQWSSKDVEDLSSYDLMALKQILCAFNGSEILKIHPDAYKDAAPELATISNCSKDVLSSLAILASNTLAFGDPRHWTSIQVATIGCVLGGLSSVKVVPAEAMEGLTRDMVACMPLDVLKELTSGQLSKLSPSAASGLSKRQLSALSAAQQYAAALSQRAVALAVSPPSSSRDKSSGYGDGDGDGNNMAWKTHFRHIASVQVALRASDEPNMVQSTPDYCLDYELRSAYPKICQNQLKVDVCEGEVQKALVTVMSIKIDIP